MMYISVRNFMLWCLFLGSFASYTESKSHFILTAPRLIDAGSIVYITLTVFDVPQGGKVTLRLTHQTSNALIAESEVSVTNKFNMWVEMDVPPMSSDVSAKLHVIGSFSNGYNIEAVQDVDIRHNTILTFVQTDKPLYKPGQTIRFRVLPMDNQLKPLDTNTLGNIWIEDPSGIRVAQWKDVQFTEGIKQFELPLSEEPPLGKWKIHTLVNQVAAVQTFIVKKYVLPKFDVIIKPPSVVMADALTIPIEICAKYTYGKLVEGSLKAKITYKQLRWSYRHRDQKNSIPSVEHQSQLSGCHIFQVNTDDLLMQTQHYGGHELEVFAEVTENVTGIVRNSSKSLEISFEKVILSFLKDNDFYKPKVPYFGILQANLPDGSPAVSEEIEICVSFKKPKECHIFTTDKNGLIQFTIKPPSVSKKILVEATTINYEDVIDSDVIWTRNTRKPVAEMILNPWYSPSRSFIQIKPSTEELECDKPQKVQVLYTAKRGSTVKFYHQVLSKGRIVQQGFHQRTFYSKIEELQYDFEEDDTNKKDSSSYNNNTTEVELGEFILTFDAKATMSPKCRLLIFYVREDTEVVADSRIFRIKKCLQNKIDLSSDDFSVDITSKLDLEENIKIKDIEEPRNFMQVSLLFRHEQQYPNTEAAMLLSASPSSLCGISMVDKSVRLLEDDTTFNTKKLFKIMESYDIGPESPNYRKPDMGPCMNDIIEDGSETPENLVFRGNHPNFGRHYSYFADAKLAFEKILDNCSKNLENSNFQDAGIIVMSDMKIKTFHCQRPIYVDYVARSMSPSPVMSAVPRSKIVKKPETFKKPKQEETSTEEIRSYFPETWLWELHSVDSTGELAIKRQLPHTITEWTGGAICVHPKAGLGISDTSAITTFQPFFIDFQLPYSVVRGESFTLVVVVFNYLSECLPIKLSLEPSDDYTLLSEAGIQKVCVCGGQSSSARFFIKPDKLGKMNITVYGYSIEQDDEICGNEVTARLSARDAIMKALLIEAEGFPKEDTYNYFICPENTNGTFATDVPLLLPDDVIMDSARAYMTIAGDVMGPALKGLKTLVRQPYGCGEQNMVLFVPNIFVLDYLTSMGKITDEIKYECINNMKIGYQRELQYRHTDGSYSAFGPRDEEGSLWLTAFVLRSFGQARRFVSIDENDLAASRGWIMKMQFENGCFIPSGTVFHKELKGGLKGNDQSLAPLTAYVLISLLESDAAPHDTLVVRNALKCLETEKQPSVYVLSLFAYANALAKESAGAAKYVRELEDRAIQKEGLKYWESSSNSKSVAVETAAYYMLARFELEDSDALETVFPVVRWLTNQRNSEGGFISTQDTVVALQALAKYASYLKDTPLDMAIAVETDDMSHGFKLEESNRLVTQELKIPDLPTTVDIEAYGDGCAIVQFSLRYNVGKMSNIGGLELSVITKRRGSNNCNLPTIGICMRYAVHKEKTNMAVLSVKLPSGFVADEWWLLTLQNNKEVGLMRHEIKDNEVNLYFQEITNDKNCFAFLMKSEIEVEDIKPSIIRLYDYYQPELQVTKEYAIPSSCNMTSLPDPDWFPPELQDTTTVDNEDFLNNENTMESQTDIVNLSSVDWNAEDIPELDTVDIVELETSLNDTENKNVSHLSAFTNVDHDLDFPDGLEGNMPVSVLPPDFEEMNCPVCADSFPDNFTVVYCNSAFALKVTKKESDLKTIKILHDVSFFTDGQKAIRKFGELQIEENCICPQLLEKGKILFIVGSPVGLWNSSGKKHTIHLTNSVYIILVPPKQIQSFITDAKLSCADDP